MTLREHFFDGLRGLSILAVIGIHAASVGRGFYSAVNWSPNFAFALYWTQLLLWAVPVFFFISGYWAARSLIANKISYSKFLTKRLSRVAVPYVLWSIVFTLYMQKSLDVGNIAQNLALGTAVGPYYFVVSLIALTTIAPWLVSASRATTAFAIAIALVTFGHLALTYWAHMTYPEANWWYFMFPPTAWIAFYGYGLFEARRELERHETRKSILLGSSAVVFFVIASFAEAHWLTQTIGFNGGGMIPIKISSFGLSFSVVYLALALRDCQFWARFAKLGTLSFGIYLIHEPIRGKISSFVSRVPEIYDVQPAFQIAVILLTLVICAGIVFSISRLFPSAAGWLGFK